MPLFSYEGQKPIHGSFYSDDIKDYYVSPYELGYGRSISFNHDFIGREALEKARGDHRRARVTFVFDPQDVCRAFGDDPGYLLRYARDRVETAQGDMVGLSMYTSFFPAHGTVLSRGLVDKAQAAPGTEVAVAWGDHPGPGAPADAHKDFPRIRATVQPSPFNEHARGDYRRNAA